MLRIGDIFSDLEGNDYEVLSELGRGGMGVVFLVQELEGLRRKFVAKCPLSGTSLECKKISNEFRILENIADKNIPSIIRPHKMAEFKTGNKSVPIFLMPLAEGLELHRHLQNSGPLSPEDVSDILLKMAKTMSEIHKLGYIHRDLKPENLFVVDVSGANDFTIIDWGIAAVKDDHNTFAVTKTNAWTPFWCPPEQESGTVSIGNDIFSLGAIGYAMIVPYDEIKKDAGNQISPPYNPAFKLGNSPQNSHLYKVIEKATQPLRSDRFATMDDFAAALEGKQPPESYPRFVADGKSHPLLPHIDHWSIGRNALADSQADILVNETGGSNSRYISRIQSEVNRTGECSFKLHHRGLNDTRIGIIRPGETEISWRNVEKDSSGWPIGPMYLSICFGYADTSPGKLDEYGNPLKPGPYKVIEYFPPQRSN
jgi:serine/threonine protein kinase